MLTNNVLLIDDDPEEFDIFCNAFSKLDKPIACLQATSCQDGIRMLDASKGLPRYIFVDLNMPVKDGRQCLELLTNHPVYSSIPIFIYTTSQRGVDPDDAKKLGAEMCFTKPSSMRDLNQILSFVLSKEWKKN